MVWLAFGAFAALGLYFWLRGHWFVRVLVFPIFAVTLGFVGYLIGAALQNNPVPHPEQTQILGIIGMLAGLVAAWPVSGLPIRHRRRRAMAPEAGSSALTRPGATATFHAQYVAGQPEPQRLLRRDF